MILLQGLCTIRMVIDRFPHRQREEGGGGEGVRTIQASSSQDCYARTAHMGSLTMSMKLMDGLTGHRNNKNGVYLDVWVWVSDSSAIVHNYVWHRTLSKSHLLDFAKLVAGLLLYIMLKASGSALK